jgi:anti-sigma regulatory factor (Ser/Thr protein kinase)
MTDGVLEASGADDIMLGEEGVRSAVSAWGSGAGVVEHLVDRVREHTNRQPDKDDMTLIALEIVEEQEDTGFAATLGQSALQGPVQWACSYEISGPTLGRFSPLPLLLHVCTQVSGLRRCSGEIYTMLAELYNNALEHGVLRLPSEWKASAGGFARYYLERQRRLCSVEDHFIRFELRHRQTDSGGELTIICEDSGEGFDPAQTGPHKEDGACYAGRGLMLLQELTDEMTINMPGNRVEVVYHWQAT